MRVKIWTDGLILFGEGGGGAHTFELKFKIITWIRFKGLKIEKGFFCGGLRGFGSRITPHPHSLKFYGGVSKQKKIIIVHLAPQIWNKIGFSQKSVLINVYIILGQ